MKASLYTLGCRLNQAETAIIQKSLEDIGYEIVPFHSSSDLAIINTCTVTSRADSDCRQVIRSYIRRNPKAYLAITGCYSQMAYKELAEIKGIDLIVGNQEKLNIVNYIGTEKMNKQLLLGIKLSLAISILII